VESVTASQSYNDYIKENDAEPYFGPEESLAAIQQLANSYNQWAEVRNLNDLTGVEKTAGGRSLYALQVSSNPGVVEDKPRILIIGNHHARELMTQHAVIDSAREYLERAESGDAQAVHVINSYDVWFVPVVNRDGLAYVFSHERMWRKNRANNNGASGEGVDLNRNYEFKWGQCGQSS